MSAKKRVSGRFAKAVTEARDLLRWRSPLRTELWAGRLSVAWRQGEDPGPFFEHAAKDTSPEARLILAALAVVGTPDEVATQARNLLADELPDELPDHPSDELSDRLPDDPTDDPTDDPSDRLTDHPSDELGSDLTGGGTPGRQQNGQRHNGDLPLQDEPVQSESLRGLHSGHRLATQTGLPEWAGRMGQVTCDGAWYGIADPHGEQTLAVLSFAYADAKEPHLVVVGIDQVNGGLAVDAVVEEPKFLDDLHLESEKPGVVAGRILDAFDRTDQVMGAPVADTLASERAVVLARARAVPAPVRQADDDTATRFHDLPDLPGAEEAFDRLLDFIADRPLWWSPARASQFLTSWLPREAILSDAGVAAMPEIARAWTRFLGERPGVLERIDADAPALPGLMADESLAGLGKRLTLSTRRPE